MFYEVGSPQLAANMEEDREKVSEKQQQWSTGQTRGAVAEVGGLNYMYYIISQFYE